MTDDYQLRKELDNYKWLFDELIKELERQGVVNISELLDKFYDQSEIDIPLTKLSNDLTTLNTSLDVLQDSLVEFNGALIDFDEDNTNLEDDLTKLKDNLLDFLNVLGLLDVDLTQLQGELSTLDVQINGDSNNRGLADTLSELQLSIGTLEGMLTDFGNQLSNVVAGDNALALSLSTLSGYLTTFKGDLSELQTQIISDYGQSIYDSLDEDLVKLIASITQANDDLDSHQDLLDGLNDTIGSDTDTLNDGTLFGVLNNTSSVASSASTKANSVESTINNTVTPTLNQVTQTDIPNVKNKMGYSSIPSGSTLQGQITTEKGRVDTINNTTLPAIGDRIDGVDGKIGDVDLVNDGSLQDQLTATNGAIDTITDTAIPDVKSKMGYSNIPSGSTLQGQITSANGNVTDVKNKMGYSSIPDNSTLQGQITAHDGVIGDTTDTGSDNTLFGLINKTIDDIGDVQDDIGDVTQLSGTVVANITTAQGNITTVQGDISDIQSDIGTVPTGFTLQGQITAHDGDINTIDNSLNTLLSPSTTISFTYVYVTDNDIVNANIKNIEDTYGITINYAYSYNGGQYYHRSGTTWSISSDSGNNEMGICGYGYMPSRVAGNEMFEYMYDIRTKTYRYIYHDPQQEGVIGYYGEWTYLDELPDFFDQTELYKSVKNHFALKTHSHSFNDINVIQINTSTNLDNLKTTGKYWFTHTAANNNTVTNEPHSGYGGLLIVEELANGITYSQTFYEYHANFPHIWYRMFNGSWSAWTRIDTRDKANSSHTHTQSDITDLDTSKSSYTLSHWETTNFSTCDVTFYKQLNMVTCIYHINTVSFANRNDHTVTASEIPSAYRPSNIFYQDICTYGGQKLDGLITVGTDGSMKIRMGTANTSMNVYGSFTYIVG